MFILYIQTLITYQFQEIHKIHMCVGIYGHISTHEHTQFPCRKSLCMSANRIVFFFPVCVSPISLSYFSYFVFAGASSAVLRSKKYKWLSLTSCQFQNTDFNHFPLGIVSLIEFYQISSIKSRNLYIPFFQLSIVIILNACWVLLNYFPLLIDMIL